ncbi:MAG: glucose-1-phosphate cytidylyltransferase [Mycobacterium sp.]
MKAVILAGGRGTRISEESGSRPKPMVEIGGKPILWHIMKTYERAGITDFIILLGYKGYVIKEYFANYALHSANVVIDFANDTMRPLKSTCEPWSVTLLDTGINTMTGGRLLQAKEFIGADTFCFTYGDGVTDLDIRETIDFHRSHESKLTVTAVQPPSRYGRLAIDGNLATFKEKPTEDGGWINGGYFVADAAILDYIEGDSTVFEQDPLEQLSADGQLAAYRHDGYWYGMDTLWDKIVLNGLWDNGEAPWKVWK